METSDDLKKLSAITDLLYEEIREQADLLSDAVPTVAMMLFARHFGERAAVKQDKVKGWVEFDKYTEKLVEKLKREGKL